LESLEVREHFENFEADGRIILKCAFNWKDARAWTGLFRERSNGELL